MQQTGKPKTKEKIMHVAIDLFNRNGVQDTSSRIIASEIGISHGNLDYHFRTKEELLMAIYQQMREEISNSYPSPGEPEASLEHYHCLLTSLEKFQYRYRFFHLDILEISRSYPSLCRVLQETLELRKRQTKSIFQDLITAGYVQFPTPEHLDRAIHLSRSILTFWLSYCEIHPENQLIENGEVVASSWQTILPYLTSTGRAEYERILYATQGPTTDSKISKKTTYT